MQSKITVVIPNLHSTFIDRTLDSLRQQRFDLSRVEVLVVGLDGPGLVQEDDLVRMISTSKPVSPSVARNIGIRHATGDLICFVDADCIAESDWLAQFEEAFADDTVNVVGGGVTFESDVYWTICDNLGWFHNHLVSMPSGTRDLLPTLNIVVRRAVIEDVGGMNEDYPRAAGEDAEWTTRMRQAGYELRFLPDAVVHHHPSRATFGDIWRHAYTYGRYSVKVNRAFFDFLRPSFVFRTWWAMLLALPVLSLGAAARIYLKNRATWRYICAFPGIWISKVAWVLGAVRALCNGNGTLI